MFAARPTLTSNRGFRALDTETTGTQFQHGCRPFMVGTGTPEGERRVWEWDVNPLTREPIIPPKELATVQKLLLEKPLVMHNSPFDMSALESIDLTLPEWKQIDDTMPMFHVISSGGTHALKPLGVLYAKIENNDEEELLAAVREARRYAKKENWRYAKEGDPHFPGIKKSSSNEENNFIRMDYWLPRAVAKHRMLSEDHPWWTVARTYLLQDVERTLVLFLIGCRILQQRKLTEQYLLRQAQLEPTYVMSRQGVTVSLKALDETTKKYQTKIKAIEQKAFMLAKGSIDNLNSHKQLSMAMFGILKCKAVAYTDSGNPSTAKEALEEMLLEHHSRSPEYHFISALKDFRSIDKAVGALNSYRDFGIQVEGLVDFMRLYPTFLPTGTQTTRYSSHDPNQQNVSKKENFNLRSVFGPLPGRIWYSWDYNNIEMRIFAKESKDEALIRAFAEGKSVHMVFANVLHPQAVAECIAQGIEFKDKYESTLYQWVKNGNFSLIYGAGEDKADKTYHVKGAYRRIRSEMRQVDTFMKLKHQEARKTGRVKLIGGYELDVDTHAPHKAVNYYVQGSAGIAMIKAIIRVHEYLKSLGPEYKLIMTVHDQLLVDFPDRPDNLPKVQKIKELMEMSGNDLGLSLPVDTKWTKTTWDKEERIKFAV